MPDPTAISLVSAALVAASPAVVPGQPLWVGVRYEVAPHWHIYWENPGDSGQATRIDLGEGAGVGDIHWPAPQRFDMPGGIVNYGYEGTVTLLLPVEVAATASGSLQLQGETRFLVCDPGSCLPGTLPLSLDLPVQDTLPDAPDALADARGQLPTAPPAGVQATRTDQGLQVAAPGLTDGQLFANAQLATVAVGAPAWSDGAFSLRTHSAPPAGAAALLTGTVDGQPVAWSLPLDSESP